MSWFLRLIGQIQYALIFLTRIPVGSLKEPIPNLSNCIWAFPLVGALTSALIFSVYSILVSLEIQVLLAAILGIAVGIVFTGALHEDGFGDTIDGFLGGSDVKSKLSIMNDSRIGSYGVLALILIMGIRITSIAQLSPDYQILGGIVAIGALSRFLMIFLLVVVPPAKEDGLGYSTKNLSIIQLIVAFLISCSAIAFAGVITFIPAITMVMAALFIYTISWRNIKGQTGDVCGAVQLISETTGWAVFSHVVGS